MICNLEVVGSNPTRGSMKKCRYRHFFFFALTFPKVQRCGQQSCFFRLLVQIYKYTLQKLLLTLKLFLHSNLNLVAKQVFTRVRDKALPICLLSLGISRQDSHFSTCPILFRGNGFLSRTLQSILPSFAFSSFQECVL